MNLRGHGTLSNSVIPTMAYINVMIDKTKIAFTSAEADRTSDARRPASKGNCRSSLKTLNMRNTIVMLAVGVPSHPKNWII